MFFLSLGLDPVVNIFEKAVILLELKMTLHALYILTLRTKYTVRKNSIASSVSGKHPNFTIFFMLKISQW